MPQHVATCVEAFQPAASQHMCTHVRRRSASLARSTQQRIRPFRHGPTQTPHPQHTNPLGRGRTGPTMAVEEVEGDLIQLLRAKQVDYVVHQANCLSRGARGLAKALFDAFPEANIYQDRDEPSVPGMLLITRPGVVHLFAQFHPGGPTSAEPASVRVHYMQSCLELLASRVLNTPLPPSKPKMVLAFPHLLGCGLAGGDWDAYKAMIEAFAVKAQAKAQVIIVKLPSSKGAEEGEKKDKEQQRGYKGGGGGGGESKKRSALDAAFG